MADVDKALVVLGGEIKTPPFSAAARIQAGYLLRLLQQGVPLGLPHSRPMPVVGPACHELRIVGEWRIMYHLDLDAVVILEVWRKRTQKTPKGILDACRARLRDYRGRREDGRR